MTPERVRQVEELFHAVLEAAPEIRAALLAHADPEVRSEVEALLAAQSAGEVLERPAIRVLDDLTATELTSGARLGPYCIETKLGEGGMGEVFRATDTRLGRAVAIKIAHQRFTTRFDREARTISSLNHPNICSLYDVGPNYLVMELVEGETLASRLKQGPLGAQAVLQYGRQIAAGLAAAHAKGIVHRDLKPGNIMIGPSGIKILDFGLAKSAQDDTVTASRMILGTPAYMAPEQKEGMPADARSDVYSYGSVLYEMSTGARPGAGRTRALSGRLGRIVERCLEADPDRRWQSAAEIERELAAIDSARKWKYAAGLAVIAALASAVYGYLGFRHVPALTSKDTIVLAEIRNETGEEVFDETLREGLAVELAQSPYLKLISDESVASALQHMGRGPDTHLTPALAREVCERTASAAVLEGSIKTLGSRYVLWLRATTCPRGDVLDVEQAEAGKDDVLRALSHIAGNFRRKVGESLAMVERHSTPLDEATTSSLEALKLYTMAQAVGHSLGLASGVPLLERAVKLDPQFAMAHARLGLWYNNLQEFELSRASAARAFELRGRTTDREQDFIATNYHRQVTGNLEKAQEALEVWARTYPREVTPHGMMSGFICQSQGKFDKAIAEAEAAMALDPDFQPPYLNLAFSYIFRDDASGAERVLQRAASRKLEDADLKEVRYYLAFLRGDRAGMDREAADLSGSAELRAHIAFSQALVWAREGRLEMARGAARHAMEIANQAGRKEQAALFQAGIAVWEGLFGDGPSAKKSAMEARSLSKSRDVQYAAALALASAGDWQSAQAVADDLEGRFSEDTAVRFQYLPVLRGMVSLARGQFAEAAEGLSAAAANESAIPPVMFSAYFGALHAAYVRGEALRAMGRYAEAAKEFQKLTAHRGLILADPVGAVARLQLARALKASGDTARSKAAYEEVFRLWKEPDQDIRIFGEARSEYGKL